MRPFWRLNEEAKVTGVSSSPSRYGLETRKFADFCLGFPRFDMFNEQVQLNMHMPFHWDPFLFESNLSSFYFEREHRLDRVFTNPSGPPYAGPGRFAAMLQCKCKFAMKTYYNGLLGRRTWLVTFHHE